MNKLYLKEPKNGHNDLTCPLKIIQYAKTHSGQYEYFVHSSIIDKTFCVTEDEVKLTPVDSEYVVDTKSNKEKFLELVDPIRDTSVVADVQRRIMKRHKRFYAACMAMQALPVPTVFVGENETNISFKSWAQKCFKMADVLIQQENEQLDIEVE